MSEVRGQKTKIVAFIIIYYGEWPAKFAKIFDERSRHGCHHKDLKSDVRGQISEVRAKFNARRVSRLR